MARTLEKKPGFGLRAFAALVILESFAAVVMLALLYLLSPYAAYWYVLLPITGGFLVSQFVILDATIWPVLQDWIKQERWVEEPKS